MKDRMRRLSFDARDRLQQSAMQTASAMHELAKKAKKKVAKKHRAMAGGPTADDLLDDAAAAEPPAVAIATDEDTGNKASP